MSEVTIKTRILHAYDTEANWGAIEKSFVPQAGEFIIYEGKADSELFPYSRCKIGDGETLLGSLPFMNTPVFVGTQAEYQAATVVNGTIVYITDDDNEDVSHVGSGSLGVYTSLPAASAAYRGQTITIESGENDVAYICLKKNGTYLWYPITTGTTGQVGSGELPGIGGDGDDNAGGETTAKLGTAKLGYMVLGQE